MAVSKNESKASLLVVEDEESIREAIKLNLELEGYEVTTVDNGAAVLKAVKAEYFDLIILDIMLPEMDGITVCENIRVQNNEVPILFLSARNSGADRIEGLRKGGDDYMTKPFNLEELLLRVEKLVVKNKKLKERNTAPDVYAFGKSRIDFTGQSAKDKDGKAIELSKKEIALLRLLIEHKGEVVSREHILQVVWGYNVYPTTRTIDNFILNFRKYFEKDTRNPKHFHSVRGVGYKFTE
ncbi:response regulator transcription factor [Taibaiella lutea]|jgi:two-component system alkaline phosphatase synthesis response regulator PhoP|uniref:Response regulator transcription factor n=1 Tax=Taibaiella lutea TaxID=2608001 RepID=A0A5M6CMS7_9BACT|nr:response regulator transcription factor [Taibaiella lutea]KAA5534449.1 response regulator transcription factor [Taibaiella lutea]